MRPLSLSQFDPTADVAARKGDAEISLAEQSPGHPLYLWARNVAEPVVALALLVVLSPVLLLSAIAVKISSRGPVFYVQRRTGYKGREFRIYKLRTMRHNAESTTGPVWSGRNDIRVTRVGRILRDTKIDEFPQLINVLLGQMSLIGPRPERPEFVAKLQWEIPNYLSRLNVRPGITGLAQLKLPPDSDLSSVRRKLAYDLHYVEHASAWLDARILAFTLGYLFKMLWYLCWNQVALPNCDHDGIDPRSLTARDAS